MRADDDWAEHAACMPLDHWDDEAKARHLADFFPGRTGSAARALRHCLDCKVRAECFDEEARAEHRHMYGIRGGWTSGDRRKKRATRAATDLEIQVAIRRSMGRYAKKRRAS